MVRLGVSIKKLLDCEESDKGKWFGGLYDVLLYPVREEIRCVFEIGIGTMLPDNASTMVGWAGGNYRPGGSLRAWRDFLPNAQIHGFDVASDTQLLNELRISTHLCDSTNGSVVAATVSRIDLKPDLVIDDGLHTVQAQIETMKNFLPYLTSGGLYICEDITYPAQEVPILLAELERIRPNAYSFVCQLPEGWAALVIRIP